MMVLSRVWRSLRVSERRRIFLAGAKSGAIFDAAQGLFGGKERCDDG